MTPKPDILWENDHLIAINKRAGVLSIPDREGKETSLKRWLQEKYTNIFTIHRIDRDTSGIIVFAKDESTHAFMSQAFEERAVQKYYLGLVVGILSDKKGLIDQPIMAHPANNGLMIIHKKGKPSMTEYEVLEEFGGYSWVRYNLLTGRTHQIRLHMQSVGHPVVCDPLYGNPKPVFVSSFKKKFKLSKTEEEERPILDRLGLHAHTLAFRDPNGDQYLLEAPLPKDLKALNQQLAKWKK